MPGSAGRGFRKDPRKLLLLRVCAHAKFNPEKLLLLPGLQVRRGLRVAFGRRIREGGKQRGEKIPAGRRAKKKIVAPYASVVRRESTVKKPLKGSFDA